MSAVDVVPQHQDEKVAEVARDVSSVVERARAIEVQTPEQAAVATEFLAEIQAAKRRSESARRFLVDPLNQHVKAINDQMKAAAAPLEEADATVRQKVIAYKTEQDRLAQLEQDRLDTERREAERQAEADRVRRANEAAQAERDAARAGAERERQMQAEQSEKARLIAEMTDEQLLTLLADEDTPVDEGNLAAGELASRREAREAQEHAARARQEAEEAEQRSIAARSAPALQAAPVVPLSSARGKASVRREWKAVAVEDISQVPAEFITVDMAAVNRQVRAGRHEIPGIRIEEITGLAVRGGAR